MNHASLPLPAATDIRIAVVGLGYVGLPLAVALSSHFPVVGFDIDRRRIARLQAGHEDMGELDEIECAGLRRMAFSDQTSAIAACNVYIIAVPTPVHANKLPDLTPLIAASQSIGKRLKRGDVVIYESTVYPGATEEVCVPELEGASGLRCDLHFSVGYSPERINPGDRSRRIADIVKVTSGSTPEAAEFVDGLYRRIIYAGTHRAPSIRVAEAAKAVENTQRDINIAFANELAMMFHRMDIDTEAVLKAAETKWNFMPVRPGLVGGHCIGVDPYYLIHKAESVGAVPTLIRAAREINEGMSEYVTKRIVNLMVEKKIAIRGARILVLGLTFKENCSDLRNTRVVEIVRSLQAMGSEVSVIDPCADAIEVESALSLLLSNWNEEERFDVAILAVAHGQFHEVGAARIRRSLKPSGFLFDAKYLFDETESDDRL